MAEKMSARFSRQGHQLTVVVEARAMEKQRKEAEATLVAPPGRTFTMHCDEGAYLQGDDSAPPPLAFLSSSIGFWLLTHVSLYAAMLRIDLKSARAKVTTTFHGEGSVRAETVMTRCKGVETTLELESDGEVQHLAKLARVAEAGCYVIQSLRHPTEVDYNVTVNGKPLDLGTS